MTMDSPDSQASSDYDPNRLLDAIIETGGLKNDAALSRALAVEAPVISKIRHRKLPVGGILLIRMHEISQLSIKELRTLMGDRRDKFRILPVDSTRKERRNTEEED
jgi:hypothetical protein